MRRVSFPTFSPFTLLDALDPAVRARTVEGIGLLFEPEGAARPRSRPAVVIAEGLGGLKESREIAYGRQLAGQGYVALAADTFATRGGAGWRHNRRATRITESMMLADAFAARAFLAGLPQVDPARIAVIGFSYGGMVSILAAYRQILEIFGQGGPGFAAHVSYYGCSVPRMERVEAVGAPVLMMLGERDRNVSVARAGLIAEDLRRGGCPVTVRIFPKTYHQWDGDDATPRHVGFNLAHMGLTVTADHRIRDDRTGLEMKGPFSRRAILAANVGLTGYTILMDAAVKRRSDALLPAFLATAMGPPAAAGVGRGDMDRAAGWG